jgi:orotidine-5'-phosphate decarboxylase
MSGISDKLIVALDLPTLEDAKHLVDILYPEVKMFKVGSQLFTACGPEAVRMVGKKGAKVFLDLKFYDIPRTVFSSVSSGTGLVSESVFISTPSSGIAEEVKPVFMMTVHTKGGKEMLEAASRGAIAKATELRISKPFIVGVTRLTSDANSVDTPDEVLKAAHIAKDAGLDGVVCAVSEAKIVRMELGADFIIVTPGIRPKDATSDDQKRTGTVSEAIAAGANFIVVGSPILKSDNPLKVIKELG